MQFGNNIKFLLKQKSIKQARFAEMMEIGNTTVSNWINGVSYPDFKTLLRIKDVLNVDLNSLIYENLEKTIDSNNLENSNLNVNIEKESSPKNIQINKGNGNEQNIIHTKDELYERLLSEKDRYIKTLEKQIAEYEKK